jgi:hypothetical protein
MQNSVEGVAKTSCGFKYVRNKFPNVSDAKIKEGIFIEPQIRELMQDKQFDEDLNDSERNAWLRGLARTSLGNHKAVNYEDVVQDLLTMYKAMGCSRSVKIHFLESHLDYFPRKSRQSQ